MFFVLLPPSIFRLVLTPRRNVWLRDRWPTQSAHTAVFFFFVLSSPVMQQAGSVWESQPGRVGCGAKLFLSFPDCRWPAQQQTVYCTTYSERLISQLDCRCCPADGNNVHISIGRKKKRTFRNVRLCAVRSAAASFAYVTRSRALPNSQTDTRRRHSESRRIDRAERRRRKQHNSSAEIRRT